MSELTTPTQVCIAGTGSYLPERILTNAELAVMVDTSDEWILSRTGIRERRIAAEGEFTSHMATHAARRALEQAGLAAEDVELIIVATITPDTPTPATACYVQQALGANRAVAFDISAACSGFLYAMKISKRLISDGAFKNALIIGAEKLSSVTNWDDRTTCVLFGDGAGAAVLRRAEPEEGSILATEMGTDGNLTHLLNIPGGGSACPITSENVNDHLFTLTMMGKEVFKHAVNRMKEAAEKVIDRADLRPEDIACVIPHQANLRILTFLARKLDIALEKVVVTVDQHANTSAASIPLALDIAVRDGRIKRGELLLLEAFGAGFTWGSTLLRY